MLGIGFTVQDVGFRFCMTNFVLKVQREMFSAETFEIGV